MTATVIAWAYGVGFFAWAVRLGWRWDEMDWDTPLPALAVLFWPLAAPVAIGRYARSRQKRRQLAAEEKRKWLDAPLP